MAVYTISNSIIFETPFIGGGGGWEGVEVFLIHSEIGGSGFSHKRGGVSKIGD